MKLKGIIEDFKKRKKIKNDNSKNISRNFSGAVEGTEGSVQFQIVPCSSLYFSRPIGPFQCSWCQLHGFNLLHLSLQKQFLLFWLLLFASLFSV